jgi:2-polyprenyl-3-methyl-5-hydroxy-6-metoxy-1,4-benzoquinol methylase
MNDHDDLLYYYEQARVRHDMMALITESPESVLEVGCGIGKTGMAIKEKHGCKVTGIDISAIAIDVARKKGCYEKLLACDLDQIAIPAEIQSERFDFIIYPDVLEHLKDPWETVRLHEKLLKPGGAMIASVPNIRHCSILKDLLFTGNWNYQQFGILDRTHLRFFTRKGMNWLLLNSMEEFLTMQYLILARRK